MLVSRKILYEKLSGQPGFCHWCGGPLTWATICADHLNSNPNDNRPDNIVGSCRGCNANREDGTGHGRRSAEPKPCEQCGALFVAIRPHRARQRFCSISCANLYRGPRGSKHPHGTEGRYKYGCHCTDCRRAHAEYRRGHPSRSANRSS